MQAISLIDAVGSVIAVAAVFLLITSWYKDASPLDTSFTGNAVPPSPINNASAPGAVDDAAPEDLEA
ncbi:hypothetical protein BC834DRAFT_971180 [Gloeopeniophorella convolvens]|nr:hypothetical protein BC834DRAFT_971180 [Gloeopeniophorella convolvens]